MKRVRTLFVLASSYRSELALGLACGAAAAVTLLLTVL